MGVGVDVTTIGVAQFSGSGVGVPFCWANVVDFADEVAAANTEEGEGVAVIITYSIGVGIGVGVSVGTGVAVIAFVAMGVAVPYKMISAVEICA